MYRHPRPGSSGLASHFSIGNFTSLRKLSQHRLDAVDSLLALSTVVICSTSRSVRPASFLPEIELSEEPTKVLCEMIGVVDAGRLGNQVGHLTAEEMAAVDDALELVLDLA